MRLGAWTMTSFLVALVLSGCIRGGDEPTKPDVPPARETAIALDWQAPVDLDQIGYEPSLAIDSTGAMFVTAHKDLNRPDTWPYPASVILVSTDKGATWHYPTAPGNVYQLYAGDEGDLAVDARDWLYYVDTYLADNHLHVWAKQGTEWKYSLPAQRSTMADDRPWLFAQGDGVLGYLGNNGLGSPGIRCIYYRSTDGGLTWTTGQGLPFGGWAHGAAQSNGTRAYVIQVAGTSGGDIHAFTTDDAGATWNWGASGTVGSLSGYDGDGFPLVAIDEAANPAVVWMEGKSSQDQTFRKGSNLSISTSADDGATWNATDITPGPGFWDHVTVAGGKNGTWAVAFYGTPDLPVTAASKWYLYAGMTRGPITGNRSFNFTRASEQVLYTGNDAHALHDFFEIGIAPDGSLNIAYMTSLPPQAPNQVDGDRHVWFVRGVPRPA